MRFSGIFYFPYTLRAQREKTIATHCHKNSSSEGGVQKKTSRLPKEKVGSVYDLEKFNLSSFALIGELH